MSVTSVGAVGETLPEIRQGRALRNTLYHFECFCVLLIRGFFWPLKV